MSTLPGYLTAALAAAFCAQAAPALAQDDDRLRVATSFTILQDMAQTIAGEDAEVVSITRPGAEVHGYQPTPQDIVRASDADLLLWNGLGLERWFEQFLGNLGDVPSAVVSEGIEPIPISEGGSGGQPNPHAWMGLETALVYVDNIRDALSEADPENAQGYAERAAAYAERLREVVGPLRERILALPPERRWLVTCEGAFSYLARDLGLRELYLWPINADQTGTPQQVRAVIDGVRENDIPAVFCESTVSQAPAEQVARETGAAYGGVLYVDSLSEADGPVPTFLDLLRVDVETIAGALAP